MARVTQVIDGCYVPWQENTFPGMLANVVAGRIANRLDLGGTNAVVDAACASSLAAISMAVNDLAIGNSDLVIAGGVDTLNDILMFMCFAQTGALSMSGDCRPFSDQADGTMLGEGVGMLALKRLADAERDGDAIYAVLRGLGSSSDGRAKSIYAPSVRGQTLALRRAYERAGYGPETVGLIEAHGTGTAAGDMAEFEALREVFEAAGTPIGHCALGSVKAQIGHTKGAAGAAGMIKAVLALHHKVLPPTVKVRAPNPNLGIETSPFYLSTEARPWVHAEAHPRRASVSALGFGGTNFHVALEEYRGPSAQQLRIRALPSELLLFSAESSSALAAAVREAAAHCTSNGALEHVARRSQEAFDASATARASVVASDEADAREKLAFAAEAIDKAAASGDVAFASPRGVAYGTGALQGDIALLFPGQGSQYVGMGGELAVHFDAVRSVFDDAAAAIGESASGDTLGTRMFPPPVFDDAARAAQGTRLAATEWAQPAITATSLGMLRMLEQVGVRASSVAGHSLGEVTAAVAAGLFDERTGIAVARRRGELMAEASDTPGTMSAVTSDPATVAKWVADIDVVLANHNSPNQVVLSGAVPQIERAERVLEAAGIAVRRLAVSNAFHSPLVSSSVPPFHTYLQSVPTSALTRPYYANATALPYPGNETEACAQLAQAIVRPVRFAEQIEAMYAAGVRTFIEVGPDAVLSRLTERCLTGLPHLAVPLDQRGKSGVTALFLALGRLSAAGVPISMQSLWDGQRLPGDPESTKPAKFSIALNGANYGKPYPPREPEARVPRPPRAGAGQAASQVVTAPAATLPASTTPAPMAPAAPRPSAVTASRLPVPSQVEAATSLAAPPHASAPTLVRAPLSTATPSSTAFSDWIDSIQRLQAPAIAAQMEFQRLSAESHMAFLGTIERGYDAVLPGRPSHTPSLPLSAPESVSFRAPAAPVQAAAAAADPIVVSVAEPLVHVQAHAAEPEPLHLSISAADAASTMTSLQQMLLEIVAEKTGYPTEMIDIGMDMEADLGIDSIKRVEILSAMRQRVPDLPQVATTKMASMRTLAQIIDLMSGAAAAGDTAAPAPQLLPAAGPAVMPGVPARSVELQQILLAIVAEKTGYPAEMIDSGMDMEADLGIDSIKRVEILSAMRQQVPDLPQVATTKMASMRTLAQIVELMNGEDNVPAAALPVLSAAASPLGTARALDEQGSAVIVSSPVRRIAVRARPAPPLGSALPSLSGSTSIVVTPDGGQVATALVERLVARGVHAIEAAVGAIPATAGGVIFLGGLRPVADEQAAIAVNREAFRAARAVAQRFRETGGLFITVQDTGGDFGLAGRGAVRAWMGGVAALAKTARDEWPLATCKALDVQRATRSDASVADAIVAELFGGGPETEVGLSAAGERITLAGVPCVVTAPARAMTSGAVFVVTGGARGVTAASLIALGHAAQPRFVILGRTALSLEAEAYRTATTDAELKRVALAAAKQVGRAVTPKAIGLEVEQILAAREVRDTLAQLTGTGASVRYEAGDVRDLAFLTTLFNDVRKCWGPIQGIVHGAGVVADAFIDQKSDAQFDRVFDTKVSGLRALLAATANDPLQWICLFSSVAARAGNAGQSDYAMANEVLNKVAAVQARQRADTCRVVSIGWGPWDGGMVTLALRGHFAERGVSLLSVAAGADAFVAELMAPSTDDVEIVIGGGDAELKGSAGIGGGVLAHLEITVNARTQPQLESHRIQGKPVLPMVLAVEWFARLTRSLFPERASVQLRDIRVMRGIVLSDFDGIGDRFNLRAIAGAQGVELELRDIAGAVRYAARVEPSERAAKAEQLNGAALGKSPWKGTAIYAADTLFHGPDFQVIRSVDGVSSTGARATLDGMADRTWPAEAWETDPAAMDGALQLAMLCGLQTIGQTLPLRIGGMGYTGSTVISPIYCSLLVRSQSPERVVCDITLVGSDGAPVADLVDVEMYAVPSANTLSNMLATADV